MKVSIVTICYNQAQFIDEAIRSVLNQDYGNIEYIVLDPGSTDGSRDAILKHSDRIHRIIFEPDRGPADALNKGFRQATGDILGFVNSDDKLLPGCVKQIVNKFTKMPSADVVYGNGYIIDSHGEIIRRVFSDRFNLRRFVYGCVTFVQPSVFFRRQSFESVGGFNPENKTSWDGELLADFGLRGFNFHLINEFLSCFRLHDSSISGTGRLDDVYELYKVRLFHKVFHRDRLWFDSVLSIIFRVEKWIHNPRSLAANVLRLLLPTRS